MDPNWEHIITRHTPPGRLQIGAPPYITSAALVHGLAGHPEVDFISASPADLLSAMSSGGITCALLPVLDALAIPRARVIPGLGVCTRGPAEADVLLHQGQPGAIQSVEYDPAASMAVALGKIIIHELLGPDIQWIPGNEQRRFPKNLDGAVVCGKDPAQWLNRGQHYLDLAEAWTRMTGKPMVHALWVGHAAAPFPRLRQILALVARHNETTDDVAPYIKDYGRDAQAWSKQHLFESVYYTVGAEEMDAIREFIAKAARLGLCNAADKLTLC